MPNPLHKGPGAQQSNTLRLAPAHLLLHSITPFPCLACCQLANAPFRISVSSPVKWNKSTYLEGLS